MKFSPLSPHYEAILDECRTNLRDLRARMVGAGLIQITATQTAFAQPILDHKIVSMQSVSDGNTIGVLLGDEIVARGNFKWLVVTDQWGTEPVVCHKQKAAFISPISVVLKRFERGDADFSVTALLEELAKTCLAQVEQAQDLPPDVRG